MENVAAGQAKPGTDEHSIIEAGHEKHHGQGFEIGVIYNGVTKAFGVLPNEPVKQLLDQAIQAFGPITNAHLLGIFTTDGRELLDSQTIHEAGLKPHEELLLRPSSVRGG